MFITLLFLFNNNKQLLETEILMILQKSKIDARKMPDVDTIYKFLAMIFKAERLDAECGIMCLAYVERMITLTGLTLDPVNWRRIVLSALILASKVCIKLLIAKCVLIYMCSDFLCA